MGERISNALPYQYDIGSMVKDYYNNDINNLPDDKFMFGIIGSGMNLIHVPFGNHAQYLVNFPAPFNLPMQLVVDSDGKLGLRCKNAGAWAEWKIFQ